MILTLTHAAHGGTFDLPTASLLYWSPLASGHTQLRLRDGSTMDVTENPPEVRRKYEAAVGAIAQAQAAPFALLGATSTDSLAALPGPVPDGDPTAPRLLTQGVGAPQALGETGWDDEEAREHAGALFGKEGLFRDELLALVLPMLATHGPGASIPCAQIAAGVEAGNWDRVAAWDARGLILAMGCALVLALDGYPVVYQQGAGPTVQNKPPSVKKLPDAG